MEYCKNVIDLYSMEFLSDDKINKYFIDYQNGDLKKRKDIINGSLNLVVYRIQKFLNNDYDRNELVSVGIIGLIKAVDHFDIKKNVKFSSFASKCIDNEILLYIRKNKKFFRNLSLSTEIDENILLYDAVIDYKSNLEYNYEEKEFYKEIKNIVDNLSEIPRECIKLYFGFYNDKCYTQSEIATILNYSQSSIAKIIKKTILRINNQLKSSEEIKKKL